MKKEYEIIITYKCNWKCEYCSVDTHSHAELTHEEVFNKIDRIQNGSLVYVSGGEPGMLSRDYLEKIFQTLKKKNCDIGLNTNGLFLERYCDLLHYIENVNYHCSENLDLTTPIIQFNDLLLKNKIDYLLVVHDKNEYKLQKFLDHYPDILFNIVPASTPGSGIVGAPELTNKYSVLQKFHKRITIESKKRLLKEKDFSKIEYL